MSGATEEDFKKLEEYAKTLSKESLECIISDCRAAKEAGQVWNPNRENYYADQLGLLVTLHVRLCMTYSRSLRRRK